jgi:hypothetical protein
MSEDQPAAHGPSYIRKMNWWLEWDRSHAYFWPEFVKYSDELRNSGARKSSAWLVVNKMRWEYHVVRKQEGDEYGISNDLIAFYARRYMASEPRRHRLFNIKTMADEDFDHTCKLCGIEMGKQTRRSPSEDTEDEELFE